MLNFEILGTPQQQGSKTAYTIKGKAVMVDANKKLPAWRKTTIPQIQQAMREQNWVTPNKETPLIITAIFSFEKPKTVKRTHMTVKPDLDKTLRAVFDVLTLSNAINDDAHIVEVHAGKVYGEPKIIIQLSELL